ncbi:MAG: DUF502 domain-containing protein [Rhabdochlamydiaceae bacterium]|nr:DUF502 domain-containing protein [Rhabdochlamydiaceae bacterium]
MKKYFFTGFITLLPIALTLIIALWLFNLFTEPLVGLTESWILSLEKDWGFNIEHHDTLAHFLSRILAFILLIIAIFILGFFGRKLFLNLFLKLTDKIFSRIPLVRTIYRISHDITKAVFSDTKKTFRETVLVPFPHQDTYSIGFVTGDIPARFREKTGTEIAVFVPTAPHPMSGYVLLTPKKMVLPVDVSVEDAFKFLISCGVIHPGESKPEESQN